MVPVGTYVAQVTDACVAQPQSGDGYYVKLTWQITEGEHEGRYVWQNITFLHSNAQAVTIGRQQFKDLCVATGIDEQVTDVEVFKFIPCRHQGRHREGQAGRLSRQEPGVAHSAARAQGSNAGQGYAEAGTGADARSGNDRNDGSSEARRRQRQRHDAALAQSKSRTLAEEIGDEIPY